MGSTIYAADTTARTEASQPHVSTGPPTPSDACIAGVLVGELMAVTQESGCVLVRYPGQPGTSAVRARSVLALGRRDVGASAVLMFDAGDPCRPIVMGLIRGAETWSLADVPAQVEVDADGEAMSITARHELVLRCGKASIALSASGKIVVRGTQILSEASGLHRIRGASVEVN